ncbi:MAG TPA: hypothetical protein VIL44_02545 [Micromonospora sp.]
MGVDNASPHPSGASAAALAQEVERFVRQVGHWTPARWSAPAGGGGGTRAELVHALVQRIADRAADAEGEPRRRVPRLDNDLVLPDQLRVVVADLVAAHPSEQVLAETTADVNATRRAL